MTAAASTSRYETFSYLPPLSEEEIGKQIHYILDQKLIPAIEFTADPGPRNVFWSMWKLPLFEAETAATVLEEIEACAFAHPDSYIKLNGYDPKRQGQAASLVVRRPWVTRSTSAEKGTSG
jgi:ribulose-bisphosphate carboxylase small chain